MRQAKAGARKLKVFQARFGFHDSVVAAPSRTAALRAWGMHQDLFADDEAAVATDTGAVKTALEHPGVPLRRLAGTTDPFELDPTGLPTVPDRPKSRAPKASRAAQAKAERCRPPADRGALTDAESALAKLEADHKREDADLRRRQDELAAERIRAKQAYGESRRAAAAEVAAAHQAYRKAGGRD